MKTAIQTTIDKMKEAKENLPPFGFHDEFLKGFNKALQMAIFIAEKNGLEAEKEQIWMAFNDGKVSAIVKNQRTPEEYYNLTFKSDE